MQHDGSDLIGFTAIQARATYCTQLQTATVNRQKLKTLSFLYCLCDIPIAMTNEEYTTLGQSVSHALHTEYVKSSIDSCNLI